MTILVLVLDLWIERPIVKDGRNKARLDAETFLVRNLSVVEDDHQPGEKWNT